MPRRKATIFTWDRPELSIYFISDTHIGAEAAREKEQNELAKEIADDENGYVIGLGDFCECISPSDYRFDASQLHQPISAEHINNPFYTEALRFCKVWEPSIGKWIGLIPGNHEVKALRDYHIDVAAIISERMGCPYMGGTEQSGWVKVNLKHPGGSTAGSVRIFVTHGWGGGELRGGDALKLQRLLWKKEADVVAIGHLHKGMIFPETTDAITVAGYEYSKQKWGIISPAQVGKNAYLSRKGANEPNCGYAKITISKNRATTPSISASLVLF